MSCDWIISKTYITSKYNSNNNKIIRGKRGGYKLKKQQQANTNQNLLAYNNW